MTSRIHLYPPQDSDREIRAFYITTDRDFDESPSCYVIKLGVADGVGVDHEATFNGSKASLSKNTPYALWSPTLNAPIRVRAGQSVVADVDVFGIPPTIAGTTLHLVMGDREMDPGQRVTLAPVLEAVDGVAEWVRAIHGDEDVVTVVLPDIPWNTRSRQVDHAYIASGYELSSGTYVDGQVSVTAHGSLERPLLVFVTAHVSIKAGDTADQIQLAIGDGTTDHAAVRATASAVGDYATASTTFAEEANGLREYKVRYLTQNGTPSVEIESITLIAMESR